jgi:hypothetical protein
MNKKLIEAIAADGTKLSEIIWYPGGICSDHDFKVWLSHNITFGANMFISTPLESVQ